VAQQSRDSVERLLQEAIDGWKLVLKSPTAHKHAAIAAAAAAVLLGSTVILVAGHANLSLAFFTYASG
jgi:hypothetical protein